MNQILKMFYIYIQIYFICLIFKDQYRINGVRCTEQKYV